MVLKDRDHINFASESLDADSFLIVSTLGGGIAVALCGLGLLSIYMSTKPNRRQLTPTLLCIILSRLAVAGASIALGAILQSKYALSSPHL